MEENKDIIRDASDYVNEPSYQTELLTNYYINTLIAVINEIEEYCIGNAQSCNDGKYDESRHKVDRIFLNGKERAYNEIIAMIKGGGVIGRSEN